MVAIEAKEKPSNIRGLWEIEVLATGLPSDAV